MYQHENVVALLDVKVGTGRNTHTGTVNAASFLFISAWGSVNMDKVCHAVH